ncbi:Glyoxalase/Bleomycin resistance protein/Dioxygenase superfamily protein [Planctomycetes bacterium Poly30]|uniref:Glyoxalase/Bleomycin resistance protein/Dioxygenase superfamily protein n=1 Tax=Saltatorellus ferox TaxID=2528018 RepID=A0A518ERB8_9BACT|nr:Glyoxalase/Bleomycin resistance protein/Dioxygenase superfamily protein [Planctomycetes bacterium Poly30]
MKSPQDSSSAAHAAPQPATPPATPPDALAPVVLGLHHVAIAVPSIADARPVYEAALGMRATEVEHVADQRVDVLVLVAGSQRIELVEPSTEDSPISKFLERSGGRAGLHHLAWHVADVAAAIQRLKAAGVQMIDDSPRDGSHHTRIAFVHPRSTGGVLMELVEDPAL